MKHPGLMAGDKPLSLLHRLRKLNFIAETSWRHYLDVKAGGREKLFYDKATRTHFVVSLLTVKLQRVDCPENMKTVLSHDTM